ncbi:MAG: tRNA pseudouridine(54/55) synthase Pus10 [Methanosphaera sp. rholeuAM130]|nr:MAG: tRNA pseudouridine(54/55) synthase Pus10 [Methanosphaera sp. rholeuAM130]
MKEEDDFAICHKCRSRIYKNPEKRRSADVRLIRDNEHCSICNNLLLMEDAIFALVKHKIRILDVDFDSFIMACQINSKKLLKQEKKAYKRLKYNGRDDINHHLKRDIGVLIAKKMNKKIEFQHPDVVIMLKIKDSPFNNSPYPEVSNVNVFIDTNPLFIEGKYRKMMRGIPQTKWPCSHCKGRGCEECNNTGQQYQDTVEGLIAGQVLPMTKGNDTKFHGSGREDIDVLMLGDGRPFVMEVKHPFRRNIDLKFLRRLINSHCDGKIEVNDLKFTDRERIGSIKNSSTESYKIYRAIATFDRGVTSEDIRKIENLHIINQRTPIRVQRRRADLVRTRSIDKIEAERIDSKNIILTIKCQGGLYIKELISGDDGRTIPSVSGITNKKAICSQLDVLKVHIPE